MTAQGNSLLTLDSSGLALPPGGLLHGTLDGTWPEPLLWVSSQAVDEDTWSRVSSASGAVGLRAVVIRSRKGQRVEESWDGALWPQGVTDPGAIDAGEQLAGWWTRYAAPEPGEDAAEDAERVAQLAPFGRSWPGLCSALAPEADPEMRAAELAAELLDFEDDDPEGEDGGRLALIPARRSADVPAAIGWTGPLNYDNDAAPFSAVLRSWEDRFGIRVAGLEPDMLYVSVAAPPTTMTEALAVAAQHFAFCPDTVWQGYEESLTEYAAVRVLGKRAWSFWWD
ncbi:DUF4253 domain-containing protein [Streptomyces sp. NPDC005262]|uniref:DUF4253 domain-containing protein n=1 Tax=Streptomyces sp. NPDC005262 TaxID=3364710 RepID=UPI0036C2AFEC